MEKCIIYDIIQLYRQATQNLFKIWASLFFNKYRINVVYLVKKLQTIPNNIDNY